MKGGLDRSSFLLSNIGIFWKVTYHFAVVGMRRYSFYVNENNNLSIFPAI